MKKLWIILIVLLVIVWGSVIIYKPPHQEPTEILTKEQNEADWLSGLIIDICVTLDWDYSTVESLPTNEEKLGWLEDNIRKVPAHYILLNEDVYKVLSEAYPLNTRYSTKHTYYSNCPVLGVDIIEIGAGASAPMRSYPNSDVTITRIPGWTKLKIINTKVVSNELRGAFRLNVMWYQVEYNGRIGWISEFCTTHAQSVE